MIRDLEKAFNTWWERTGQEFSRPDAVEDVAEFTRLLCRIAYCQGRIDECDRVATESLRMLQARG